MRGTKVVFSSVYPFEQSRRSKVPKVEILNFILKMHAKWPPSFFRLKVFQLFVAHNPSVLIREHNSIFAVDVAVN